MHTLSEVKLATSLLSHEEKKELLTFLVFQIATSGSGNIQQFLKPTNQPPDTIPAPDPNPAPRIPGAFYPMAWDDDTLTMFEELGKLASNWRDLQNAIRRNQSKAKE